MCQFGFCVNFYQLPFSTTSSFLAAGHTYQLNLVLNCRARCWAYVCGEGRVRGFCLYIPIRVSEVALHWQRLKSYCRGANPTHVSQLPHNPICFIALTPNASQIPPYPLSPHTTPHWQSAKTLIAFFIH